MKKYIFTMMVGLMVSAFGEVYVKQDDKIAFLGDSITAAGWNRPQGYVKLVAGGLEQIGVKVEVIPAGASGHTSVEMLKRVDRDVVSKEPTWMTLSCGVNDVWRGKEKGIPLETFKTNIAEIVSKAQTAGIKVMIITASMIYEDKEAETNLRLVEYNEFLRSFAKENNCLLADVNADMQKQLDEVKKTDQTPGNKLTSDGVHMAYLGNKVMAKSVLRAFGLNDEQLKTLEESWDESAKK